MSAYRKPNWAGDASSAKRKAAIKEDDPAARELVLQGVRQMYIDLLHACRDHKRLGSHVPMSSARRVELEPIWSQHFEALNEECLGQTSFTDVGFQAMMMSIVQEHPERSVDANSIASTFAQLVVISCQHTPESRTYWPQDWPQLKQQIAEVVTCYFDGGPKHRAELIRRLESGEIAFVNPIAPSVQALYEDRKTPPELVVVLEQQKRDAAKAKAAGAKDYKEGVSEDAMGAIWRNTSDELIHNYVQRAARVVYKVDFDNALVAKYPCTQEVPDFVANVYQGAKEWVTARLRMEQTEDMTEWFRNTANTWFLPMASETARYRSKETASNVVNPLQMLEAEIGVHLGQWLHELTLVGLQKLSEMDLFWDIIFLSLFHNVMKQRLRLNWVDEYFVAEPQLKASRERMSCIHYMGNQDKRPMVVWATRRYFIFWRNEMKPCKHLLHAVLAWLRIMETDYVDPKLAEKGIYRYLLENAHDVAVIHAMFLTRL